MSQKEQGRGRCWDNQTEIKCCVKENRYLALGSITTCINSNNKKVVFVNGKNNDTFYSEDRKQAFVCNDQGKFVAPAPEPNPAPKPVYESTDTNEECNIKFQKMQQEAPGELTGCNRQGKPHGGYSVLYFGSDKPYYFFSKKDFKEIFASYDRQNNDKKWKTKNDLCVAISNLENVLSEGKEATTCNENSEVICRREKNEYSKKISAPIKKDMLCFADGSIAPAGGVLLNSVFYIDSNTWNNKKTCVTIEYIQKNLTDASFIAYHCTPKNKCSDGKQVRNQKAICGDCADIYDDLFKGLLSPATFCEKNTEWKNNIKNNDPRKGRIISFQPNGQERIFNRVLNENKCDAVKAYNEAEGNLTKAFPEKVFACVNPADKLAKTKQLCFDKNYPAYISLKVCENDDVMKAMQSGNTDNYYNAANKALVGARLNDRSGFRNYCREFIKDADIVKDSKYDANCISNAICADEKFTTLINVVNIRDNETEIKDQYNKITIPDDCKVNGGGGGDAPKPDNLGKNDGIKFDCEKHYNDASAKNKCKTEWPGILKKYNISISSETDQISGACETKDCICAFYAGETSATLNVALDKCFAISDNPIKDVSSQEGFGVEIRKFDEQSKITLADLSAFQLDKASWMTKTDGGVNWKRLGFDALGGVAVGALGGFVTNAIVKNSQVDKGFDAVRCKVAGQETSGWGDSFSIGAKF
ncbi:MAG: hypothetical protein LBB23_02640 [Rickettsiales bacterium]|jgi:hypothetical protein|nr:hypothetical protein [Rickettsiales bacterium]